MTEDPTKLFGAEHVRRYRETDGEVGHIWKEGSTILLLTTKGRTSGEPRTAPLIYAEDGDRYVIVASQGGAPEHPGWYRNLAKDPHVELQVLGDVFTANARTAEGEERERQRARNSPPPTTHFSNYEPIAALRSTPRCRYYADRNSRSLAYTSCRFRRSRWPMP